MKRGFKNTLRFLLVTAGVVVITSVSIDATDSLRGSQTALTLLVREFTDGKCPADMVEVERPDRSRFCIDRYESVTGADCLFPYPSIADETARNASFTNCSPQSIDGKLPWTNVTQVQAGELCARAKKRLPSSDEWYAAVRGTPDNPAVCALDRDLSPTGALPDCRSGVGAFDMVGNVWEWVSDVVADGELGGKDMPGSGFVSEIDTDGTPRTSSSTPSAVYNDDYVWTNGSGSYAVMRGGFHRGRSDAGIYSMHAAVSPQFASPAIGFRCALSL